MRGREGEPVPVSEKARVGLQAATLSRTQVLKEYSVLRNVLRTDIASTIPDPSDSQSKRDQVGLSLYYRDNPLQITQTAADTITTYLFSPNQDTKHHASEALASYVSIATDKDASDVINSVTSISEHGVNEHFINALHDANVSSRESLFQELPYTLQTLTRARGGDLPIDKMKAFIEAHSHWATDILEISGKHHPEVFNDPVIVSQALASIKIPSSPENDWKRRAIALDLIQNTDELTAEHEELYTVAKEDEHPEVRVRARNALISSVLQSNDQDTVDTWTSRTVEDYAVFPEDTLRYTAAVLPVLLPHSSELVREDAITKLLELSVSHEDPYIRKTSLKSLAKLSTAVIPGTDRPLYDETIKDKVTNRIIGALQDVDPKVQEEAMLSIAKRLSGDLSILQRKKILTNIDDPSNYDWQTKRAMYEAIAALHQSQGGITTQDEKPDVYMFPGTFDPIHNGHIEAANQTVAASGRQVWLTPNISLKRKSPLAIEERITLIRKSIADQPNLYLIPSDVFLQDDGTYIDNKIEKMRKLAQHTGKIGLIRGSDVLERKSYQDPNSGFRDIDHVIAIRDNAPNIPETLQSMGLNYQVVHQETSLSSTEFRNALRMGDPTAYDRIHPLAAHYLKTKTRDGMSLY